MFCFQRGESSLFTLNHSDARQFEVLYRGVELHLIYKTLKKKVSCIGTTTKTRSSN